MNPEIYETDILTMLLSWQFHKDKPEQTRANKISKTLRKIRAKTKHSDFYNTCSSMIEACRDGRYSKFFEAIEIVNRGYIAKSVLLDNQDLIKSNENFDYLVRSAMDNKKLESRKQVYYYLVDLANK